ncbi:MAG: restriction endonuclease [Geminicoccaceae bacterium]
MLPDTAITQPDFVKVRRFTIEQSGLPDLPQMMLVSLEALRAMGGSATLHELDQKVVELEGVTEDEQAFTMPNDSRARLNYFLGWSRTYLRRGGAIENSSRGVWSLTEKGEQLTTLAEMQAIYERVNAEEREKARLKRLASKQQENASPDPEPSPGPAVDDSDVSDSWKSQLLAVVGAMQPDGFERLSQRLLREADFTKVEVRGKTGDGGIDGVGILRVNLVSFQVYFQCKKWKGSVGSKEIRDFRGALQGRADKGLFITTGSFTSQASEEATRDGAIAIDLIDGERLCELLKQHGLGVKTEMIESVTVVGDWFKSI